MRFQRTYPARKTHELRHLPVSRSTAVTLSLMSLCENIAPFDHHQRMRLDGFDIEWGMDAARMNTPAPARRQEIVKEPASLEEFPG